MAITLDDVVIELEIQNDTLSTIEEQTNITFEMQNKGIGTLIQQMDEFISLLRYQARIAAEERRERGKPTLLPIPPPTQRSDVGSDDDDDGSSGAGLLGGIGARVRKLASRFGKYLRNVGRIFGPLFLAFDIFEGVQARLADLPDGASFSEKFDAITRGVLDGIVTFVFTPVELLKDVIGWIGGQLGFEQFEETLASFDVVDLMKTVVQKIYDILTFPIRLIGSAIESYQAGEGIMAGIAKMIPQDSLTFELPSTELFGKTLGGGTVNLNPIPDEFYNSVSNVNNTSNQISTTSSSTRKLITEEINSETLTNVGNSQAAPIIIQDNSVKSSNQNNVSNQMGNVPMASPVNDNRSRASAYATG